MASPSAPTPLSGTCRTYSSKPQHARWSKLTACLGMRLLELTFSRYVYGSSAHLVLAGGHTQRITRSIAPHSPGSNRVGKFRQKTTTCRISSTLFYDCSVGLTTGGSSFCRG